MANIKTDISLSKSLLAEAEDLARELKISRSRLFALAVKDFIQRYQTRRLIEQINRAYPNGQEEKEDHEVLAQMRSAQRRLIGEEEW